MATQRILSETLRQIPRCYPPAGTVERSHQTDSAEFYWRVILRNPAELD